MILLLLTLPPLASSSPPPPSHCPGTLVSSGVQDSPVDVTAPTPHRLWGRHQGNYQ